MVVKELQAICRCRTRNVAKKWCSIWGVLHGRRGEAVRVQPCTFHRKVYGWLIVPIFSLWIVLRV